MKHTITLAVAFFSMLAANTYFAQEVTQFEKVFYHDVETIDADAYTMSPKNGVAQADHFKFALKIENKSDGYLFIEPSESVFHYEFGDKTPVEKPIYIGVNDSKTRTIKVDGGNQFRQEKVRYELKGIYKIPLEGETVEAEDFQLPASKNSFTAGDFKVSLKKYSASTKEAKAQFECTYMGDDIAIVNPSNLSVRATRKKSDEQVIYANDDKKSKPEMLRKGESITFNAVFHIDGRIVDMQFATMYIIWNNTFVISQAEALPVQTIEFTMNEEVTKAQ